MFCCLFCFRDAKNAGRGVIQSMDKSGTRVEGGAEVEGGWTRVESGQR